MLTANQLQTLKAAIAGNPTWAALPNTWEGSVALASLLNTVASPAFMVWRTDSRVSSIIDAIDLSKYTPNDAPDGTATYTNRVLAAQTKQINLQLMLQGRDTLNTALVTVRSGLRDAVIAVPTGTGGALVSPGGASGAIVLAACTRMATEVEKILATAPQGSDTTGSTSARVMTFEGVVSVQDADTARNL